MDNKEVFLSQKRIPKMRMKILILEKMMMMVVMMMILKRIPSIRKILGIIKRMRIMHVKSERKNNFLSLSSRIKRNNVRIC